MFDKSKVFLGITPTGWTNDDMPLLGNDSCTFEQIISEMALAGFQGCSIGHKYPTDPALLRPALKLRGLRVSEPWVSLYFAAKQMREQTLTAFRKQMVFIKAMGGTDLVVAELTQAVHQSSVSAIPNKPDFTNEQWKALTLGLNEIGRMAADEGMRLAYHPHVGTGVMTLPEIDRLMTETDPKLVTLLYDTGHLYYAGIDPLKVVKKYARRIFHCHLKDIRQHVLDESLKLGRSFLSSIEAGVFTVPGDGCLDFPAYLGVLAQNNFEGWLVVEAEQDPGTANPLEYALKARKYLKQVTGL